MGAFLVDNATIRKAAPILRPAYFYDPIHESLCELILEYEQGGRPVTPLTLHAWCKHWPGLQEVGGLGYLAGLAQHAPAMPNVVDYALILQALAERRKAIGVVSESLEELYAAKDASAALAGVVKVADEITMRSESAHGLKDAAEAGDGLLADIEHQAQTDKPMACPTGLDDLNAMIGGLAPGLLIVLAGRPGMGKTIVATNFARAAAEAGWSPDYWSLEVTNKEISARLQADIDYDYACANSLPALHYSELVQLRARQEQLRRAVLANGKLRELGIAIFDVDSASMERIAATSRARAAVAEKPKLFIIDHLGLIEPDKRYAGRKVDELSVATKAAKRLAKRTRSPVLLLAQLSRGVEGRDDKRPVLSDLRDSGSIEEDADVVIMLYRGAYYASQAIRQAKNEEQRAKAIEEAHRCRDELEIWVPKNRRGAATEGEPLRVHVNPMASAVRTVKPVADAIAQLAL